MSEKVKKPFYKRWWFIAIVIIIILAAFGGGDGKDKDIVKDEDIQIAEEEIKDNNKDVEEIDGFSVKHGELLDVNISEDDTAVFKAKIEPNLTNKMTLQQNGFNIEDLIKNQGADKYGEIQYWAVADMDNGSESKVISFTVNEETIQDIKNGNILGNEVLDYVDDLWILPSLEDN